MIMKGLPENNSRIPCEYRIFSLWMFGLWVVVVGAVLVLSAASLYFGELNQDEGWYLYAARLVSQGKLPYVDFCFTQGPVMAFVYSLAQPLVDKWGVAGGRLFSVLMNLGCMILAGWLAFRLSVPQKKSGIINRQLCAALLAVMLIGVNAYQVYFSSIVKTYSLTSLFLVAGFLALSFVSERGGILAAFLSGVFLSLAAGTRTSAGAVIPVVFFFFLWCLWYAGRIKKKDYEFHEGRENAVPPHIVTPILPYAHVSVVLAFSIGAVLTLSAIFVPFIMKAPEAFRFGMFDYHMARDAGDIMSVVILKAGCVLRLCGSYFVPFGLFTVTCLYVLFHRASLYPARVPSHLSLLVIVSLSAVAVWLVQILVPFPYDEYQVNIYPLFAVVLSVYLSWVMAPELLHVASAVLFLSVASVGSSSVVQSWFVRDVDRLWVHFRERSQLEVLQQVGRNIRDVAGDNTELFTQDAYLAVEAGMTLPHGLEMGPFCYAPDWGRERAEACHILNRDMMVETIKNSGAHVAALSGYGFAVETPAVVELSEEERELLINVLMETFMPFRQIEYFGQGDTRLRIFLSKDNKR